MRLMILIVLSSITLLAGCSNSRARNPLPDPPRLDSHKLVLGEKGYMHYCDKCHPGGGKGLGPAVKSKPLPKALIRLQVRQGMGAMPAFSDELLPDDQLGFIANYIKKMN